MNLLAQANEVAHALNEALQQEANTPWYERLLDKYGLAMLVVLSIGGVCWKYGPRVIDAGLEHLKNVNEGLGAIVRAVDSNHQTQSKSGDRLHTTVSQANQSLLFLSRAAREACEAIPEETRRRVVPHLDAIERLLGGS